MNNIIGIAEGGRGEICWSCQEAVAARALFCHDCGSLQPPRALDHFTRLHLEKQVDVDRESLKKAQDNLLRVLAEDRFALRGMTERGFAARQREAVSESFEILADPIKRGRYWLTLMGVAVPVLEARAVLPEKLADELRAADNAQTIDRLAQQGAQAHAEGIGAFLRCLKDQDYAQAQALLRELEGLENFIASARGRRQEMPTSATGGAPRGI